MRLARLVVLVLRWSFVGLAYAICRIKLSIVAASYCDGLIGCRAARTPAATQQNVNHD